MDLSIIEYTFRALFEIRFDLYRKKIIVFAVVSALRIPVERAFLYFEQDCVMIHIEQLFMICGVYADVQSRLLDLRCFRVIGSTPNFFPSSELSGVSELRQSELSGARRISFRVLSYRVFPSYGNPSYR